MNKTARQKGFTLIELLVVVTILTALAVAVFVALNPGQRIIDANNARRSTDVDTILSAVHTYIVDSDGAVPTGLTTTEQQIGTDTLGCAITTGGCNTAAACYNLATNVSAYLASNPIDPQNGSAAQTRYSIVRNGTSGIVTVRACSAQNTTIQVAR